MIYMVKENIWFDNEKLNIIKGKFNYFQYSLHENEYSQISRKNMKNKYPTIVFLSSTACNLKCKYCFADKGTYGGVSKKKFFELKDYQYVYELAIRQYGGVNAISFFGGEPMLNIAEIVKFVNYLHENYQKIPKLAIASNGTLMTQEIKQFLGKYSVHFCTSLDGPKEYNDLSRVGNGIASVYDLVSKTLLDISDLPIVKGLQMTLNRVHIENYKKGDVIDWLNDIEGLGIDNFELVPVTSEDEKYKIDLTNRKIYEKFVQLCTDYADYCLEKLKMNQKPKSTSKIFIGLILHIIKRVYQEECSAGFSFCVSPDGLGYACHVCADKEEFGVEYDENFRKNIENNQYFNKIKAIEKNNMKKCNNCIAKNVCSYICKGLSADNNYNLPIERCLMMEIFLEKVIIFLAESYGAYSENIKANILKINLASIHV